MGGIEEPDDAGWAEMLAHEDGWHAFAFGDAAESMLPEVGGAGDAPQDGALKGDVAGAEAEDGPVGIGEREALAAAAAQSSCFAQPLRRLWRPLADALRAIVTPRAPPHGDGAVASSASGCEGGSPAADVDDPLPANAGAEPGGMQVDAIVLHGLALPHGDPVPKELRELQLARGHQVLGDALDIAGRIALEQDNCNREDVFDQAAKVIMDDLVRAGGGKLASDTATAERLNVDRRQLRRTRMRFAAAAVLIQRSEGIAHVASMLRTCAQVRWALLAALAAIAIRRNENDIENPRPTCNVRSHCVGGHPGRRPSACATRWRKAFDDHRQVELAHHRVVLHHVGEGRGRLRRDFLRLVRACPSHAQRQW